MIVKPLRVPSILFQLDGLRRRLPPNHERQTMIREQWRRRVAGYKGERSLQYELSFLDPKRYDLFHDVRLAVGDSFVQFDLLIVCSRFIVVVEVKNIAGQLYFDPDFHQLIRTFEGEIETFPDPIVQNERQVSQLQRWLSSCRLPTIPILSLVVISSPHSQIQTKKGHESLSDYVIHKSFLPKWFNVTNESISNLHIQMDTFDNLLLFCYKSTILLFALFFPIGISLLLPYDTVLIVHHVITFLSYALVVNGFVLPVESFRNLLIFILSVIMFTSLAID
ncbi:hypothetical protein JCM9152_2792 [Halalkalibacter hemicellulosilyticusJCM 9152]|uniref:NERD domain-containing protein n=1 Tax=Halalkalibacter hemicellulosilyticusJCM 9152 TaxID=1236971 RepID=W4QI60_9BACI|nr:nuclease-related domain-containing protein [Halalkalibacter hemicellulosilyticus]GAE31333.1 hypothetical protein JCM9152_2792 [Halalkalibacter hemicellulosilyticusJCM 9152]